MKFLKKAELLTLHLFEMRPRRRIVRLDQLSLENILERCKAKGLHPVLGLFVKPGRAGGDAWRCSIALPGEGIVVGTSADSAWDSVAEAVLRYYGAWEETE